MAYSYRQELADRATAEVEDILALAKKRKEMSFEERDREINPDYYDEERRKKDEYAYRWHQIGAHERVYRRRLRQGIGNPDEWYQGPEATQDERDRAYEELATLNPHWRPL